jgi:hypothetical protein
MFSVSYQLYRPHGMHGRPLCLRRPADQLPTDRDHWRELKRHVVRMKVTLNLVHTTLGEESERGIPLTAETGRKLEGYAQRPWAFEEASLHSTTPGADLEKSSCKNVGSPSAAEVCRISNAAGRPYPHTPTAGVRKATPAGNWSPAPRDRSDALYTCACRRGGTGP